MNDYRMLLPLLIEPGVLAPEFSLRFYRSLYVDLMHFDDKALADHYAAFGRTEGRMASPASDRLGFLAQIPRDKDQLILEIGPAVRPTLTGPDIRYFEISDRDELITRALAEGYDPSRCPEKIDFVSPVGDLSIVDSESFNSVFSSHCIEHQPDFVSHLLQISRLLKPTGCYFIIIPDKRYCFDALLPESRFEDIRAAYQERRKTHTLRSVIEHRAYTTHNECGRHWIGDSADPGLHLRDQRIASAEETFNAAQGAYVDVHAWQFTPDSFRGIIEAINNMDLPDFDLSVVRVYQTIYGSHEFCAILKKNEARSEPARMKW